MGENKQGNKSYSSEMKKKLKTSSSKDTKRIIWDILSKFYARKLEIIDRISKATSLQNKFK